MGGGGMELDGAQEISCYFFWAPEKSRALEPRGNGISEFGPWKL